MCTEEEKHQVKFFSKRVASKEEAEALFASLNLKGIPFTDDVRGFRGLYAENSDSSAEWPLFEGAPYNTTENSITAEEYLEMLSVHDSVVLLRYDDPRRRTLGFIKHDHSSKITHIYRLTLSQLKSSPLAHTIMQARK